MPIETNCLGCGQRLRVADEHAGKKARCPNCQTINPIPGPSAAALGDALPSTSNDPYAPRPLSEAYSPSPLPASPTESASLPDKTAFQPEMWTLKIDDGRTFGPVDRAGLDQWFNEGRVTPGSQLLCDSDNRWRPAGEVYPSLGRPAQPAFAMPTSSGNPFADREPVNPYAPPYTTSPRTWREPHNGVLILVLGLIGTFVCALLGPVAAYLGHNSLSAIRAGRMDPEGHGLIIAGTVLGWIGTLQLLAMCGCVGLATVFD